LLSSLTIGRLCYISCTMENSFYALYQKLRKEELIQIVVSVSDYQPDAIEAAKKVIAERKWTSDLQAALNRENLRIEEEKELYENELLEKAEYYQNAVRFKKENNRLEVRIGDIPKFEGALYEADIKFFREDKNPGLYLEHYPTQTYFFKNEDAADVDKIAMALGMVSNPHMDIKPFWKPEMKLYLIAAGLILLGLLLFFA
jgi:hypothetical protein